MSAWTPLLPAAMVGTDRRSAEEAGWTGEIGALVASAMAAADTPAERLLRAAAVIAPCAAAGHQPSPWLAPPVASAPEDTRSEPAGGTLTELLRWTLLDGPARLQALSFETLDVAGLRLPASLLPTALELGRRSVALRPSLLAVLGERGLWLAARRDDWRYAAGVGGDELDPVRWTDGTPEQRRAFLARERALAPDAARERLAEALPDLPAKERADLVELLSLRLGPADEPLLDRLRADRARDVREHALRLLLALPGAAHPARAASRMAALLRQERALLRLRWVVEPPTQPAPDWAADQVLAARPAQETLGDRGWWLYQLVRQVPLAWWTTHLSMTPTELLAWSATGDWTEALRRGWFDALAATREVDWCEACLELPHRRPDATRIDPWPAHATRWMAWLPQAHRERRWLRELERGALPLGPMLAACTGGDALGEPLSRALAAATLASDRAGQLRDDPVARAHLPDLVAVIHPAGLDALASLAALARDDAPAGHADLLRVIDRAVAVRRALLSLTDTTPRTSA